MNTTLSDRDVILVIGPSSCGKTYLLNTLRAQIVQSYGLKHEFKPLSDSQTILERVKEDDDSGGLHHYHPWSRGQEGHNHVGYSSLIPFTLAGNKIGHAFIRDFFRELPQLPHTGVIRYAEWSGGKNTNIREDPAHLTDLSFETITRLIRKGNIPGEGLDRVLAAIHIETPREYRYAMNDNRSTPEDEEIRLGTASWQLDQSAMNIFGEDDFMMTTPSLLRDHHIPFIYTLHNNSDGRMDRELRGILPEIVSMWSGGESGRPASIVGRRDRR